MAKGKRIKLSILLTKYINNSKLYIEQKELILISLKDLLKIIKQNDIKSKLKKIINLIENVKTQEELDILEKYISDILDSLKEIMVDTPDTIEKPVPPVKTSTATSKTLVKPPSPEKPPKKKNGRK